MKRLLFVSYYFPPHLVAESLLAGRTAKALARAGWDITVLTNLEKVPGTRNDPDLLVSMPSLSLRRTGGMVQLLARTGLHKPLRTLGLPEVEFPWILPAVSAGVRLARENSFDIIHSWASCHASNVAGLELKRRTGLPWVPHFSDPWLDNSYWRPNVRQAAWCRRLEAAVIREADAVVFTTEETVDLVMRKYPESWRRKAVVVPHGYDADLGGIAGRESLSGNKLRLIYTGGFYGIRSPEWFLRALKRLEGHSVPLSDLEVVFVGPMDTRFRDMADGLGLGSIVRFTGTLAFKASLHQAAGADVLLVIDAPSAGESVFLPSKLVDYLMFEKPILGLTPSRGASANLLRELGCPVVAPDDEPGIAEAVASLHARWKEGNLKVSGEFARVARRYHIDETTRALSDCFEACLSVRPGVTAMASPEKAGEVTKKARVALMIDELGSGGAPRAMSIMANYWASRGHSVALLAYEDIGEEPFFPLDPRVEYLPLNFSLKSQGVLYRTLLFMRKVVRIRRTLLAYKPEAVISFGHPVNVLCLLATMGTGIQVVVSERVYPGQKGMIKGIWKVMRYVLYPWARSVVVQTERVAGYFRPRLNAKLAIIPNPVPAPSRDDSEEGVSVGKRTIVSFGRLDPQKGFDLLLRAFADVAPRHPEWELAIFGAGKELEALQAQAKDLGLNGRARFPGRVKNPYAVFRKAGLYVSSSRYEGFPNALCEAMASGMPVVATDCPTGPREIIRDGVDGLLVPNEDVAAIAHAMDRMMGDEELRRDLGAKAATITERFSTEAVMSLWEKVLREQCGIGA